MILVFAGCSGALMAPLSSEEIIADQIEASVIVHFELVSGVTFENYSSRIWLIDNDILEIDADMSGDGRMGRAKIVIDYSSGSDHPQIIRENDNYKLLWPFEKLTEVHIGDVDKDGDADIVIDANNEQYFFINKVRKYKHAPPDDEEFALLLKDINNLMISGDLIGAFGAAASVGLGSPHSWSPPGEGKDGLYDRDSVVNLNIGNCVTWVETVFAMMNSNGNYSGFLKSLIDIRYADGVKEYPMRNHFQSADWIPNNIAGHYIIDLLPALLGDDVSYVEGLIDKRGWYQAKSTLEGDFSDITEGEMGQRLAEFQLTGAFMEPENVRLGYYPFEKMVEEGPKGYRLDRDFINQLPEISIFDVVNENLEIKDADGNWITDLIVSHVGLIVKEGSGNVLVYHSTPMTDVALSIMAQEDFLSFLVHRYLDNDHTKAVGLHLSQPTFKTSSAIVSLKTVLY
jgi:hypothetical protein